VTFRPPTLAGALRKLADRHDRDRFLAKIAEKRS
jgi:hypothetical protein